ncbi:hypothetical protein NG791_10125 [Laspinema sp. D1]|uniref:hypothetical protein n=1 Tax=Laspinema palackyanum TaxID=3231601 RepID=UPI0034989262|nr:hypothetical protein [Laspinema sp. D2b]
MASTLSLAALEWECLVRNHWNFFKEPGSSGEGSAIAQTPGPIAWGSCGYYHKKADLSRSAANYLKDLKNDIESMVRVIQRRSPLGLG